MCTLDDFVSHIEGCRINDEQNKSGDWKVWKREIIGKAVKEAISAVYSMRPELFAEQKEVTLKECECVQCFCEDCCRIVGVISVGGNTCNKIEEKDDGDDEFSLDFLNCYYVDCGTPNCTTGDQPDTGEYDPGTWDQVESSPCCIRFENPPPMAGIKAIIACVPTSVLSGEGELPCSVCGELFQAIVDNTLFRLYAIDHKDGNNLAIARLHWEAFQTTMVTKFAVDYSLFENNYLLTRRRVDG